MLPERRLLREGMVVVAVAGPLDVYSAPRLRQEVLEVLEGDISCLVIDLTHADHLDSTGLGVLLSGMRHAGSRGCEMKVLCGNDRVRRAFEVTGLTRVFDIYRTERELLDSGGSLAAP